MYSEKEWIAFRRLKGEVKSKFMLKPNPGPLQNDAAKGC